MCTMPLSDETFVDQCYWLLLNRVPDEEGKRNYLRFLRDGHSRDAVLSSFLSSDEFNGCYLFWQRYRKGPAEDARLNEALATIGSDSEFVEQGYQWLLGRPADAEGKQWHLAQLAANAARTEVLRSLLRSPEFRTRYESLCRSADLVSHGGRAPGPADRAKAEEVRPWSASFFADALYKIYNTEDPAAFNQAGEQHAKELLPYIESKSTVLEIGCGVGRLVRHVAPRARQVFAVDASADMLRFAKDYLKDLDNVELIHNDGWTLSAVMDASVDFVYSWLVFQHIDVEEALSYILEAHRVLKPQALLWVQFAHFLGDHFFSHDLWTYALRKKKDPGRVRGYTIPQVIKLLQGGGFSILSLGGLPDDIRVLAQTNKKQ
jgi:SAM-dependent methyltransferase